MLFVPEGYKLTETKTLDTGMHSLNKYVEEADKARRAVSMVMENGRSTQFLGGMYWEDAAEMKETMDDYYDRIKSPEDFYRYSETLYHQISQAYVESKSR